MYNVALSFYLFLALSLGLVGLLIATLSLRRRYLMARAREAIQQDDLSRLAEREHTLEHAHHRQQHWTSFLFNRTDDMVFVHTVDAQGNPGPFIDANDMAVDTLQYPRERLRTMNIFDVEHIDSPSLLRAYARLHDADNTVTELAALERGESIDPDNVIDMRRRMKRLLEDGQAVYEQIFVTRDGRHLPVQVHAELFDEDESRVVVLSAVDMTAQQETLQALRDSRRFTHDFFAHSAIGVAIYDGDRSLTDVNRIGLRMFGIPDRAEFGRFNMFDNPFLPPAVREPLGRGESVRFETTFDFEKVRRIGLFPSTKTGRAHYDIVMSNLGLDKHYEPKGYLVQMQDITQRREAEEELRQREKQLRQAQKLQAIGTLAGGIAHDFNNILTPVLGYTEMALDLCGDNETIREYLQEVVRASMRAKELANQILTFSRQSEPEGKPIRITPIVKEVLNLQRAALPEAIRISRNIRAKHDIVIAEPSQLHQIMMNLCTNASHAMRERGGELEVSVLDFRVGFGARGELADLAPGPYARITVRDTGSGIAPEILDRIFEPFFTTKQRGEGTGMGLAVVHGIIASLHGRISVDSSLGVGTAFHVLLPSITIETEAAPETEDEVPNGTECILFVDDEPDIVRMQSRMLASLGYRPVTTHRSTEALRLFEQEPHRFDLVISDQVMPDLSGLDLARHVNRIRPDEPIIICTGFSDRFPMDRARQFGVRELLMKPVSRRQLATAIRRALDAKEA